MRSEHRDCRPLNVLIVMHEQRRHRRGEAPDAHLEVDDDQEDDDGGHQLRNVGQRAAVERLLERSHLHKQTSAVKQSKQSLTTSRFATLKRLITIARGMTSIRVQSLPQPLNTNLQECLLVYRRSCRYVETQRGDNEPLKYEPPWAAKRAA